MLDRDGIFVGDNPIEIAKTWLAEAAEHEPSDPNAVSLATVDANGMPNVRVVLLKEIEADSFVFYTNYESQKASELDHAKKAAFVYYWKSLGRQVRVRGHVTKVEGAQADAYYASRSVPSRIGAWASQQSRPLESRGALEAAVRDATETYGDTPPRPPHWGGFRVTPIEIEFWADGAHRLHDRFRWTRSDPGHSWEIVRLNP